jgi:hypothetical protein
MSTTMIVCLIIIGICTLVIIVSKVYELIQRVKLEEANKLLIGLKGNITEHDGVKYAKWLPYCPDYFGYTEDFECTNCHNLSKMPVVNGEICYFEYCPHCGMKMMYMKGD